MNAAGREPDGQAVRRDGQTFDRLLRRRSAYQGVKDQGVKDMKESSTYQYIFGEGAEAGETRMARESLLAIAEQRFGQADRGILAALEDVGDLARLRRIRQRVRSPRIGTTCSAHHRHFRLSHYMKDSSTYQYIFGEGKLEGQIEATFNPILEFGEYRFGPPDESVRAVLASISDLPRLLRMHRGIRHAADWKDLLATPQQ
jgi:hypothetical protein